MGANLENTELTQLVYTRISHDLSGAAGAVYNGTELLKEDASFTSEAADLIQSSADNLMKRLRFFRQTFGLQNQQDTPDTTADYLSTFSMPFSVVSPCESNLQRVLVMMLTDFFYKGAVFNVASDEISATGEALKECEFLSDILQDGKDSENANDAPAVFAYALAQQLGQKLSFTCTQNSVTINIHDSVTITTTTQR